MAHFLGLRFGAFDMPFEIARKLKVCWEHWVPSSSATKTGLKGFGECADLRSRSPWAPGEQVPTSVDVNGGDATCDKSNHGDRLSVGGPATDTCRRNAARIWRALAVATAFFDRNRSNFWRRPLRNLWPGNCRRVPPHTASAQQAALRGFRFHRAS